MRIILLNGVFYEVRGEITKKAVNPWVAKVSSGGTTYEDYSQAALEEYFDFRNGIGKKRGVGSDARLEFSEGIDFTTEGQAVLGPLVNTAGTFGLTPVKIIDFQDKTYAIASDGSIKVWNTTLSTWDDESYAITVEDCEDVWNAYQNSKVTHAVDATDKKAGSNSLKLTVTSATVGEMLAVETISSADLTGCSKLRAWIKSALATASGDLQLHLTSGYALHSPDGFTASDWANEANAYDGEIGTSAGYNPLAAQAWTPYIILTHAALNCDRIQFRVYDAFEYCTQISIDVYYGSAWHNVYEGTFTQATETVKFIPGGVQSVTSVRVKMQNNHATLPTIAYVTEIYFGTVTTEKIDVPALSADTWTKIYETITTPANLATVTEVGIKSVTDLGTEPYIIRIDDVRAVAPLGLLTTAPLDVIDVTDGTDQYLVVSSAGAAQFWDGVNNTNWVALSTVRGYLAFYATKLWGITTTGGTLYSSAANNIDGAGDNFALSGQFGTIYDLFEGKLLADGTPTLYMLGTEGLYTVDTTNEIAYKQEVEYPPLTYSGHVGKYWNGSVWISTGFGILKITPSMATFVGPDLDDGLPSTYQGSVYDFETVNNWLIFCTRNNTSSDKSSIFKRNSSYGGNLQIYTSAANTAITCLYHSPSSLYTNGRLWFGEGTNIKYMMFPDTTSVPKQIATYQYVDDSGYGTFPIFRKLAVIPKVALAVGAITKSCDDNEYVNVYYGLNGAAATTSLGSFKTSPKPTVLKFASGVGTEFFTIQFAIKLIRGTTNTNSPELESLLFYYLPRPARVHAWTFNIVANTENAEVIIAAIEAVRDTNTMVVFNETGDSGKTSFNHYVAISSMPLKFVVENQTTRQGVIQVIVEEAFTG